MGIRRSANVFAASILTWIAWMGTTPAAAASIDADHPNLQFWGRMETSDPKKPRFDWPGVSIRGIFTGSSLSLKVEGGDNRFHVVIDGQVQPPVVMAAGQTVYPVAENLSPGTHSFSITKRTEGFQGITAFLGLELADGGTLEPPPARPSRRLLFIGDSFTVGYGNEATSLTCSPNEVPYTNNALAYGSLTASALGAEYSVQAISGKGMVHNYGDSKPLSDTNGPLYFDRILMNSETPEIDPEDWTPHAITVAYGTNDFSTAVKPSEEQYATAYKAFLQKLRGYYPDAVIVCIAYPVDNFQSGYVKNLVADLTGAGFENLHTLDMPAIPQEELGCDWHPGLKAHEKYSAALIAKLEPLLGSVGLAPARFRQKKSHESHLRTPNFRPGAGAPNTPDAAGRLPSAPNTH